MIEKLKEEYAFTLGRENIFKTIIKVNEIIDYINKNQKQRAKKMMNKEMKRINIEFAKFCERLSNQKQGEEDKEEK